MEIVTAAVLAKDTVRLLNSLRADRRDRATATWEDATTKRWVERAETHVLALERWLETDQPPLLEVANEERALGAGLERVKRAAQDIPKAETKVAFFEALRRLYDGLLHTILAWVASHDATLAELPVAYRRLYDEVTSDLITLSAEAASAGSALITDEVGKAEKGTAAIEDAAGRAGNASLAYHFQKYRDDENRLARSYQLAFLTLFALTSLVTGYFALRAFAADLSLRSEVSRLAISIPAFAMSYFFARRSGEHRSAARQAQEIAVRLQTMEAFTASGLTDDGREEIRRRFGTELFSVSHLHMTGKEQPDAEMASVVSLLADAVAKLGGGNTKPKL